MVASGKVILDNYEQIETTYADIEETSNQYDLDSLDNSAETIQDILSEEPKTSVYQLIPNAVKNLRIAKTQVSSNDRTEISNMINLLEEEVEAHPAQTSQRHYDSRRDQANL